MRVTTKSRYGLRAMIQLAIDTSTKERTTLCSIAGKQDLSERYLEQIFSVLKKSGLVQSARGVRGGYSLSRDPSEITVADILKALEDPVEIVGCLRRGTCVKENDCVTYMIWKRIFDCMINCADSISLQSIVEITLKAGNRTDGKNDLFGPCSNNEDKR